MPAANMSAFNTTKITKFVRFRLSTYIHIQKLIRDEIHKFYVSVNILGSIFKASYIFVSNQIWK